MEEQLPIPPLLISCAIQAFDPNQALIVGFTTVIAYDPISTVGMDKLPIPILNVWGGSDKFPVDFKVGVKVHDDTGELIAELEQEGANLQREGQQVTAVHQIHLPVKVGVYKISVYANDILQNSWRLTVQKITSTVMPSRLNGNPKRVEIPRIHLPSDLK